MYICTCIFGGFKKRESKAQVKKGVGQEGVGQEGEPNTIANNVNNLCL